MCNQEEDIGEDHIEKEGNKSCGGLETTVENTGGQVYLVKTKQVQEET